MGLYDRGYVREDSQPWEGDGDNWKRGYRTGGARAWTMISILIAINVTVWLLDAFSPNGTTIGEFLSLRVSDVYRPWYWWRFLTYGFVHGPLADGEVLHLAGNMLTLFFLGRAVEQVYGTARFMRTYLAAIVFSGLIFAIVKLMFQAESGAAVCGASGAVAAVLAIFVFRFPQAEVLMFGIFPLRAWVLGAILVIQDVLRSFAPSSHGIAAEAHLAGFAFGWAVNHYNWQLSWLNAWNFPAGLTGMFKSKPRLRVMREEDDSLDSRADALLEKISRQGANSLTKREQKILDEYSKKVRKGRS